MEICCERTRLAHHSHTWAALTGSPQEHMAQPVVASSSPQQLQKIAALSVMERKARIRETLARMETLRRLLILCGRLTTRADTTGCSLD